MDTKPTPTRQKRDGTIFPEHFSAKETALLTVMLSPDHRTKSIDLICKIAGCSHTLYKSAMCKEYFIKELKRQSVNLAIGHAPMIVNAFVSKAVEGSFQHGQLILKMADVFHEEEAPIKTHADVLRMTDEDIDDEIFGIVNRARKREALTLDSGEESPTSEAVP